MFRSAILLLAAVLCGACGHSPAPVAPGGRVIVLTDSLLESGGRDTLRLGRLHSGETAVSRLWFENRTAHPLVIVSYERTCGCTSLAFDSEPFAPGAMCAVELTFDSRGERGWQFKPLDLRFAPAGRFRLFVEVDVE
ncbi:MAG: DUF1573 domain-containing protein [Alistipes sp.]|nr:DUF1573 domain-containing protein [Alistipes sp.]